MHEEQLAIQAEHLALWAKKVRNFEPIRAYILAHNRPGHVWRGQDIIEIIREWPDIREPYPPIHEIDEIL